MDNLAQGGAPGGPAGGQMHLVGLDVPAAQIGDAADLRMAGRQPEGKRSERGLDVHHGAEPEAEPHLLDIARSLSASRGEAAAQACSRCCD